MAEAKRGGRGHGPQGHGFQRPKDFRGTVKKLLAYIGRYKAALVLVFICLVISSVGSVMSSYLLKPIINDYILPGDFAGLLKMLALLLGLFLLSGLCSYAYARIMVHISQQTVAQLRQDLFDKLQSLPLRYFDTHQSGDLMSRFTNDMDTVSEMINSSFASVVSCALTFIGIVAMMLYMNWLLTLITFAFLVLMLLVVKGVGGRSRVSFQAQQQALGAMNGYIEEMVEGQKVIKVFNHEGKAIEQFAGLNTAYQTAATAAQTYSGAMMPAMANLSRIDCRYLLRGRPAGHRRHVRRGLPGRVPAVRQAGEPAHLPDQPAGERAAGGHRRRGAHLRRHGGRAGGGRGKDRHRPGGEERRHPDGDGSAHRLLGMEKARRHAGGAAG